MERNRRDLLEDWITDFRLILCLGLTIVVAAGAAVVLAGALSFLLASSNHRGYVQRAAWVGGILGVLSAILALEKHVPESWSVAVRRGIQRGALGSVFTPLAVSYFWSNAEWFPLKGFGLLAATLAGALLVDFGVSYALKLPPLRKRKYVTEGKVPGTRGGERRD